jgi:hypothetical protein
VKNRLVGLLVFLGAGGMIYYNWHTLFNDGYYYPKVSFISPLVMLAGVFMTIAPSIPTYDRSLQEHQPQHLAPL